MRFPCAKLTPLQSRFVASFSALCLLGIVYWSLSNPHFAYAAELAVDGSGQARSGEDHNWHRIEQSRLHDDEVEDGSEAGEVPLLGRAAAVTAISANNAPNQLNIQPGNTTLWVYSNELFTSPSTPTGPGLPSDPGVKRHVEPMHHDLKRRQDGAQTKTIYVSINTCVQPTWNETSLQTVGPPQLTLYVSSEANNDAVGPDGTSQVVQTLSEGFANVSVTASGTWYIAVSAPALPSGFVGVWNYELAVSHDAYYHSADESDAFLFQVDTDFESALLVTGDLTQQKPSTATFQQWLDLSPPFSIFAANVNDTSILGMQNSYCGWSNKHQVAGSQLDLNGTKSGVQMSMITRGLGSKPKEQFYVTNLDNSSSYIGVLAQAGNSTNSGAGVVGGGGKIWQPVPWQTKTDGNCALMFDLPFCSDVAYAVPSNPQTYNITGLREVFDNYTSVSYQQFAYSLQQIPCNTTSDAQYSNVKTCDDCAAAYKQWLCAVSIPRCEDFTNPATYLQKRNMGQVYFNNQSYISPDILTQPYIPMSRAPTLQGSPAYSQTYNTSLATNSSRNTAIIDSLIMPGPYNELLPCEDLCYSLVQSCPSSLGFGCPYPGRGLEAGYGVRSTNGSLTCSYLGAVYSLNAATDLVAPVFRAVSLAALVMVGLGVV
ncbi:hypothetical protein LTR02_009536 [Friedmanniomyces endolithicus]|nr:hypothetical protein LTR94_010271 [Friedmanniomyces endolithicus]KAK0780192.1 hypothetical protein LTR59_012913 [Friedmanniomyces endolithicus]KAK0788392.1 hypothetical protein LTR38_011274 [Friedmanniomyces endolithicus]KAK0802469.1 hypothetical protein LTR75_008244 [Friedmanniomyces endolithicus]KAK0839839.1 hypothetical protein LTR03_011028 [Friedmanniomyces endolithicus]